MQFSEQWLRTWCNPNLNTQELAYALTMAGLEIEDMQNVANAFEHIVIGLVQDVQPHPNADKLRVCMVDVGQHQLLQIVCGASNVRTGIKVPCALVGAYIDFKDAENKHTRLNIKPSKLRGIDSNGMLCSAEELGLLNINATQQNGLLELDKHAPIGENIRTYLNLDDCIFTIKLTPNRSDCLSIMGIARDLAAITNTPLTHIEATANINTFFDSAYQINIDAQAQHNLCSHFSLREIKHIQVDQCVTPEYIQQRLVRSGLRSVNILVDISNYVMLELGQPSHIFDANFLGKNIRVHWSDSTTQDIKLCLLNDAEVNILPQTGLISDENGVQCLAGVMGGKHTSVTNNTTHIVIECAFWQPHAIAGKTKQYKLNSDAAYRYERGVDPYLNTLAIQRITQLILAHCATDQTQVSHIKSIHLDEHHKQKIIDVNLAHIYHVIGCTAEKISIPTILDILGKLNLQTTYDNGNAQNNSQNNNQVIKVLVPSYRFDLNIPEDIIEEIIRIYGVDNIHTDSAHGKMQFVADNSTHYSVHDARQHMAHLGYHEVLSFGFTSEMQEQQFADIHCIKQPIYLKNPIAEHYNVMRSNIIGGLVEKLVYNQQQHRPTCIRLFETGKVFRINTQINANLKQVKHIQENQHIAGIVNGLSAPQQWGESKRYIDFYDVKGDIENLLKQHKDLKFVTPTNTEEAHYSAMHPGRCADIFIGKHFVGRLGELHPELSQFYNITGSTIIFELDLMHVLLKTNTVIQAVNKFPMIKRDIAVIVDNAVAADVLINALYAINNHTEWFNDARILNVDVFDVFKPNQHQSDNNDKNTHIAIHEKSIALQFCIQKEEGTFTEKETEHIMSLAMQALQQIGRVRSV
jgi:phenylalanyl-tRNA synthetase beta chain